MPTSSLLATSVPTPNAIPISDGSGTLNDWFTSGSGGIGTVTHTGPLTLGQVVLGNGAADIAVLAAGTNGYVLTLLAGVSVWAPPSGGGGSPGGANTQVQFNNAGAFGGSANFTFNGTDVAIGGALSAGGIITATNALTVGGGGPTLALTGATNTLVSNGTNYPIIVNPNGTGTFQVPKKVYFGNAIDITASARDFNVISTTGGIALIRTGSASPFIELVSRATATSSDISFWDIYANSNSSNLDDLTFRSRTTSNINALRLSTTQVSVLLTTAATSPTDGALVSAGGLSVALDIVGGGSIKTGAPSGGTAAAWKLGSAVTSVATTFLTTSYLQVDVNGTLFKLALVSSIP
jgi:hypothetical protein